MGIMSKAQEPSRLQEIRSRQTAHSLTIFPVKNFKSTDVKISDLGGINILTKSDASPQNPG